MGDILLVLAVGYLVIAAMVTVLIWSLWPTKAWLALGIYALMAPIAVGLMWPLVAYYAWLGSDGEEE